ncbi:hypothetical protein [Stenotrophomonas sp. SY1]|uniref:hypothetical protein n=1 Tax=Stenotrophomonas sp. SY1 TaxID=477235 RepID=UPI001E648325|nr:hypothetical protein [Stenotrophomonas sp. SY1]
MRRAVLLVASVLAGNAGACVAEPSIVTREPGDAARAADIVAVIHVDHVARLTAKEQAETDRLFTTVSEKPFVPPAPSVRVTVRRMLKGAIPVDAVIRNGATSCEVHLAEGGDYVLFAMKPAASSDRIVPMNGTFRLDKTRSDAAKLAAVESSLTHPDLIRP